MLYKEIRKFLDKNGMNVYFLFRIVIAFLLFSHGAQKLYGWFGGSQVELMSIFGLAGIVEFYGGILLFLGLFTRYAAFIGALEMIGAWFIVHVQRGWIPINNGGETVTFLFVSFLLILFYGPGKWALDNKFFGKKY